MSKDFVFSEDVALSDLEMAILDDRKAKATLGERRLLLAILNRAKEDLSSEDERIRIESEEWFYSSEEGLGKERDHLPFNLICCFLNLDPDLTRKAIFKEVKKDS